MSENTVHYIPSTYLYPGRTWHDLAVPNGVAFKDRVVVVGVN